MKACFIGHRNIQENQELINSLKKTIIILINKGVTTFLFGSKSKFYDLSWKIVSELKTIYPFIKRVYVRSNYKYINKSYEKYLLKSYEETYFPAKIENAGKYSYVERNYEMIDKSTYSGTKIAYNYAMKKNKIIINLYK